MCPVLQPVAADNNQRGCTRGAPVKCILPKVAAAASERHGMARVGTLWWRELHGGGVVDGGFDIG